MIAFTDYARLAWTFDDAYRVFNETARRGSVCGEAGYACPALVDYAKSIDMPLDNVTYTAVTTICGEQSGGFSQTGVMVTATINFTFLTPFNFYPDPPDKYKTWTVSTCFSKSL